MNRKIIIFVLFSLGLIFGGGSVYAQAPPPQLVSPSDGATDLPTTVTFEWSSVSSADRYQIQVADDPSFASSSIGFSNNTTSTSITVSGFSHSSTYYWRVRSGTDNPLIGGTTYGDWSQIRYFTTVEAPPPAPALVTPEDGATDVNTSPTLDWQAADRADTYQLQVGQSSNFSSPVVDQSGISSTEQQVSDLEPTTSYYWRVRATNDGGAGNWSETRNFTTSEGLPSTVQLVSPDSGATGVTTTPRMEWQQTEKADNYDFQVAVDQNFNQTVINLDDVTSTYYNAELEGYTTYFWRVRGTNENGAGAWSQVWNFTTERTGNEISITAPIGNDFWRTGETSSIHWEATNNIENVTIEYRESSVTSWTLITENIDADSSPYGWTIPNVSSPHALIRISDTGNPDISTTSEPFIIYPDSVEIEYNYSFTSFSSTSDYRLVGLPAQTNMPLDELFQGQAGKDWNAYFDNGAQQNYMIEFDGTERFNMQPGRAFFVISKSEVSISDQAPSVSLDSDTTFAIPLQEGWNMISNPFDIDIPWENIQARNDISSILWGFEGSYTEAEQLKAYKGYYFFNQDSLDQLLIPYQPSRPEQSKTPGYRVLSNEKQMLTLKLVSNRTEKSSIQVGFDPTITGKKKARYQFAPPGDFQDYKLTLVSEKFEGRQSQLVSAVLPPPETKQTFSVRLKAKPGVPVRLKAEGTQTFDRYEIMLIDRQTSKSYDLKQMQRLQITPDQSESPYLLVIGTSESVRETTNNLAPSKITLSQNYPNPFNGQTVIEYSVPANLNEPHVALHIFNILGQKILTLVDKQQSAGSYTVRWNAEQGNGQSLASGVYYYRLQVGEKILTRQLTLIE